MKFFLIAILGLLGVFCRYYVSVFVARVAPMQFPLGTFIINIVGSFLIGVVYVVGIEKIAIPSSLSVGLLVGFLGGFTTFSSFALESVRLTEQSNYLLSGVYLFGSPVIGFLAAMGGLTLVRALLKG